MTGYFAKSTNVYWQRIMKNFILYFDAELYREDKRFFMIYHDLYWHVYNCGLTYLCSMSIDKLFVLRILSSKTTYTFLLIAQCLKLVKIFLTADHMSAHQQHVCQKVLYTLLYLKNWVMNIVMYSSIVILENFYFFKKRYNSIRNINFSK